MKKSIGKELWEYVKMIIFVVVFVLVVNNFLIINAKIPSESMENTIMTKDRIVAFRFSYLLSKPERQNIIILDSPNPNENKMYLKRIIGLPGETLNIIDGKVYINDSNEPLPDEYIMEEMLGSFGPYTIPKDSYFMMGDNRNDSQDSRYWENTFLSKDNILGKVIFKYYPKIESLWNK